MSENQNTPAESIPAIYLTVLPALTESGRKAFTITALCTAATMLTTPAASHVEVLGGRTATRLP